MKPGSQIGDMVKWNDFYYLVVSNEIYTYQKNIDGILPLWYIEHDVIKITPISSIFRGIEGLE